MAYDARAMFDMRYPFEEMRSRAQQIVLRLAPLRSTCPVSISVHDVPRRCDWVCCALTGRGCPGGRVRFAA